MTCSRDGLRWIEIAWHLSGLPSDHPPRSSLPTAASTLGTWTIEVNILDKRNNWLQRANANLDVQIFGNLHDGRHHLNCPASRDGNEIHLWGQMHPKCKNQAAFHIVEPKSGCGLHKKTVWQIIIQIDSFCLKYNSSKLMFDVNKLSDKGWNYIKSISFKTAQDQIPDLSLV